MRDQLEGKPCLLHECSAASGVSSCAVSRQCDLMVFGTPCQPYSTQRQKRWNEDSVMNHDLAARTFTDAYDLLAYFQPVSAVMEQTQGFDLPLYKGASETPMTRPVVPAAVCYTIF